MGRVQVHMLSEGACSQVPPGAPGEAHGREGHVRGREALGERVDHKQSFGREAPTGREAGEWGHPRVHNGANCAKCQNLAQERVQREVERWGERGAHALSNEGHMSFWG